MHGYWHDADRDKGHPDPGILRAREPVGTDRWPAPWIRQTRAGNRCEPGLRPAWRRIPARLRRQPEGGIPVGDQGDGVAAPPRQTAWPASSAMPPDAASGSTCPAAGSSQSSKGPAQDVRRLLGWARRRSRCGRFTARPFRLGTGRNRLDKMPLRAGSLGGDEGTGQPREYGWLRTGARIAVPPVRWRLAWRAVMLAATREA
jgi:hypothetical protein